MPPLPSLATAEQFRLEIDTPSVNAGKAIEPVTGRLTIEGWAMARSGISGIEVMLNDQRLGDAHYGLARQDVGAALPDWTNSSRSGFAFHCPPRSLRNGDTLRAAQLFVHAAAKCWSIASPSPFANPTELEDGATIRRRMTQVEGDMMSEDVLNILGHPPWLPSHPASRTRAADPRRVAGDNEVIADAGVPRLGRPGNSGGPTPKPVTRSAR